jgi:6-phosphofructokinase 1
VDRQEAREVGRRAVEAATSGEFTSGSVALKREEGSEYRCTTFITPLESVAKYTKDMPEDFLGATEGVTQAFLDYAMPLTGGIMPMTDLDMVQI